MLLFPPLAEGFSNGVIHPFEGSNPNVFAFNGYLIADLNGDALMLNPDLAVSGDTLLYNQMLFDFMSVLNANTISISLDPADDTGFVPGATNVDFPTMVVFSDNSRSASANIQITPTGGTTSEYPFFDLVNQQTVEFDLYDLVGGVSTPLAEGTYEITARIFDGAGGTGDILATSRVFFLAIDRSVPTAWLQPELDANSNTGFIPEDNLTNSDRPLINYAGVTELGQTFNLHISYIFGGIQTDLDPIAGSSPVSLPLEDPSGNGLADGNYEIFVKVEDEAGNMSPNSPILNIVVDTSAPVKPTMPIMTDASDNDLGDATTETQPYFKTSTEANALVKFYLQGNPTPVITIDNRNFGGSGVIVYRAQILNSLADGTYSIYAEAEDEAGNVSETSDPLEFEIDTTPPAAPSMPTLFADDDTGESNSDHITKLLNLRFEGIVEPEVNIVLQVVGESVTANGVADENGDYLIPLDFTALGAGTYQVIAKAIDAAGNESAFSTPREVTIETTPPNAPSAPVLTAATDSGRSDSDNVTNATTIEVIGTTDPNSNVTLVITGVSGTTTYGPTKFAGGNYSFTISNLPEGNFTMRADAQDVAGNGPVQSGVTNLTIDRTAPAQPSLLALDPGSDSGVQGDDITNVRIPQLNGTTELDAFIEVSSSIDGDLGSDITTTTNFGFMPGSNMSFGLHEVTYTAEDLAGNLSPVSDIYELTIVDTSTPAVTLVSTPLSISENGGVSTTVLSLSSLTDTDVVLDLDFTGTATFGSDYTISLPTNQITIPAGTQTANFTHTAVQDNILEEDETIVTTISGVASGGNATIGNPSSSEITIIDQSALPTVTVAVDVNSISENSATPATITLTVNPAAEVETRVDLDLSGTALVNRDFTISNTSVVIPASAGSADIEVFPIDNSIVDGTRQLTASLTNPNNLVIAEPSSVTIEITDDDQAPAVTAVIPPANKTYLLGEEMIFRVNYDSAITVIGNPVMEIAYNNADGNGIWEAAFDGGSTTSTLIFKYIVAVDDEDMDGITIQSINLKGGSMKDVHGNVADLTLNNVGSTAGVLVDAKINDLAEVSEDGSLLNPAVTTTDQDRPTGTLTFDRTANDDPQTKGYKIMAIENGSLKLQSGTNPTIGVGDYLTLTEAKTLGVVFEPSPGYFGTGRILLQATLIEGNDSGLNGPQTEILINILSTPTVTLATNPLVISENGGVATSTLSLTAAASSDITVALTFTGTAERDVDYNLSIPANEVTIPAGQTSVTFTYTAIADNIYEGDEAVITTISNIPTGNAFIGTENATTLVIQDQSPLPVVSIAANPVSIPEDSPTPAIITVNLNPVSALEARVNLSLTGTALVNSDYTISTTTAIIPAGSTSVDIQVQPIDNDIVDGTRQLIATLVNPTDANIGSPNAVTIEITDDDSPPSVISVEVPNNKTYLINETMEFTVNFDRDVTVIGNPTLLIDFNNADNNGTWEATYDAVNSSADGLKFKYTVQANDEDLDGITVSSLSLNGATIRDGFGNDADVTLNNVGNTSGVLVDAKVNDFAVVREDGALLNPAETTVDQDAETGKITLERTANDELQTKGYKITAIENGTLVRDLPGDLDLAVGDYLDYSQASSVGFRFIPTPGFFGTGRVRVHATLIEADDAGLSGPTTEIIINVNRINQPPVIVDPAPAAIVATYGDPDLEVDLTTYIQDPDGPADGATLSYTISIVNEGVVTGSVNGDRALLDFGDIGTTQMTITLDDGQYVETTTTQVTVNPAMLTVTAEEKIREYGEPNPELTYTFNGFVNGEDESIIDAPVVINTTATVGSNVGEYPITISGGNAPNYEITYVAGTLIIVPAPLEIIANDTTIIYGDPIPEFTGTISGIRNNDDITDVYDTDANSSSPPGDYSIIGSAEGEEEVLNNYDIILTDGTLTIREPGGVFVPTVFTPNGDGSNDVFRLRARGVAEIHFRLYNAQGVIVWETRNVAEATETGWDGRYEGRDQPQGNYVWQVSGTLTDGSPIELDGKKLGNVSLVR
ncbi:Ig-like domain-containing protein [Persicobacter diffluens]|uniref:Uncharacterized protein n=1 Tax=Persicobacter diffluens TaxID=981 RepID=A0AAN4W146_9BACT|nr:hypothetical protein PEDI_39650 [Persicobacter diffluens]